jgi:hypothetical protein
VSIEPFHLFRYLDEQSFRFNNRVATDADRFALALKGIIGKRLSYAALTGSELPQMLKKAARNKDEDAPGVAADDPVGTMDRFKAGLQRVLNAKRASKPVKIKCRRS